MASDSGELGWLNAAIDTTPLIDNHAHPLLTTEAAIEHPLLSITSEATGDALADSRTTLAHIRAVQHLAGVLGCEQTWEAVEAAVGRKRLESRDDWVRRCFDGIETILIDDGLDIPGQAESYSWHSKFTKSKCKRIVRIETVASDVIAQQLIGPLNASRPLTHTDVARFIDLFQAEISRFVSDPDVVGFKSIICYRLGLDFRASGPPPTNELLEGLETIVSSGLDPARPVSGSALLKRLEKSPINDLIVHLTAEVAQGHKPIQFHTGLGDNDITLTKSSPSHLQDFIRQYPDLQIVLLHAGYPWTRETAYLAAMYPNVYADIGEIFPCISRQGQEDILRQMLEVCPWSKILCSTDGHGFPEMFLIATTQIRSALKTVLGELVQTRQLDKQQAIRLVQDILFSNSKKLYKLETESTLPTVAQIEAVLPPVPSVKSNSAIIQKLRDLDAKYLRIYWHDYSSISKCRLIPIKHVYKTLSAGKPITLSLTKATFGMTQVDGLIPQITATGMYIAHPDWSSLKPGPVDGHVSCYADFTELDGSEEILCPRTLLRKTVQKAAAQGLTFLLGFEIEFMVLERNTTGTEKYRALDIDAHAWSVARALADWGRQGSFSSAVDEILTSLETAGIDVEQFHAENAPGQFELVLAALPPLEACDSMLHARQILESVAARHGFRITLHPKPFTMRCGSASHVHMSISSPGGDRPEVYESFYAGILKHLRAIIAITYSNPTSYTRMVDSFWAGGRWVAWGTQNKETALRKVEASHWELKVIDGLANPYFAVAALLAAGADGVQRKAALTWRDCIGDPAALTPEQRKALGIEEMFPANLREALDALRSDKDLGLDPRFVQRYVDVKEAELALLAPQTLDQMREWVMERY